MPAVLRQLLVHGDIGPQRVPAIDQAACAIDAGLALVFFLERAKDAVPDDENAAVIAIQILVLNGVMHAVVAGRAKPAVKPAQLFDLLGMHPELVEQIDQAHHGKHHRRHACQRHGQVKHPAQERARAGLAQRGRQVIGLALMVHGMGRPEHAHLVAHAVQPVVAEIVKNQCDDPATNAEPEAISLDQRHLAHDQGVDAQRQQLGEDGAGLAQNAEVQRGNGIGQRIGIALAAQTDQPLNGDQQKKHRCGDDDDLAGGEHGFRF